MGWITNQLGRRRRLCAGFRDRGFPGILEAERSPYPQVARNRSHRDSQIGSADLLALFCYVSLTRCRRPPLFTNPEDFDNIVRMMAIFSLFGGCYIAEVIRGGLQAVDSGQKEVASLALGLSPMQIKLQVELPNAVRTTLPSIVSVFIGLWKDTTLLFIIEIIDFFRIAKTMANTDLRFLGDFLEPVYFTALIFWVFAFYLSRVSMNVERSLGLVKEGGGDVA